jgi:ubiquinone/menaquinone biosynthesis C-methylase UbiE
MAGMLTVLVARCCFRPGDVVVEFCAGSGYVALPLACLFPQCTFVLLDKKEPSLAIGTRFWKLFDAL